MIEFTPEMDPGFQAVRKQAQLLFWFGFQVTKEKNMLRKTKIICTIGPASEAEETLTAMCEAGMNIDMYLTLDGDDKAKGAMMGQFPIEGKRK